MSPAKVLRKIAIALRDPRRLTCYLRWEINRRFVRTIVLPSGVYHRYRGELYPDYLNHGDARSFIREKALGYCSGVRRSVATWLPSPAGVSPAA